MNPRKKEPPIKNVPHGTKRTIIIPELEEAVLHFKPRIDWTDEEKQILKDYYGRVDTKLLAGYLKKSLSATASKASDMGLSFKKGGK